MARPKGQPKLGGRKKGTPNKISSDVKGMVLGALNKAGGEEYLLRQSKENPTAFMTLVGKVLPTTLAGDKENPVEVRTADVTSKLLSMLTKEQLEAALDAENNNG
ncbi:hypothetical protein J0X19_11735 [Hymenobacter sp. BT186]|uniref:DUF5681 domain-containing protein n=1 Tax=Hymenobacter telluris TaxID=2816474 RepID=A0A939JD75_9BACT|nr:hypothetical protein [Hymenobacter telluris]MBO0358618.1 hypothetical protein [Hymenobacter telluris]MBW3374644.1 hypothetical protein [Hymenobacter norwichensis]